MQSTLDLQCNPCDAGGSNQSTCNLKEATMKTKKTNYMIFRVFAGCMFCGILINYADGTQSFIGIGKDTNNNNSTNLQPRLIAYKRLTLGRIA